MNMKYWVLVGILVLGMVFLMMDKCGFSRKADELKEQYEEASRIAEVERHIKEEVIKEQQEKIGVLDATIVVLNTTIAEKDNDLEKIEDELGELKRDFVSLKECQAQYDKLVKGFNLCKSINADKESVIFSLNEKYDAQVVVSTEYKSMYESTQDLLVIRDKQVKELEKINKRLRLGSGLKTGIVVTMAAIVAYSLLKD